ncbi:TIGR03086 family metal-binding protein [Streptomyces alkaliterrae]|uniref:TIGR03086 family metal-binding protein n=1 Tax=Streptomyces alkaliterrae TaxID=2213162 RepID=UPI001E657FDF|nr:TIGR03086 family metal-binding protein [Streptomyces alkaliterrae]
MPESDPPEREPSEPEPCVPRCDPAGARLLVLAAGYAARTVRAVRPEQLERPTPCAGWDVRMLLTHLEDSVAALCEGLILGRVAAGSDAHGPDGGLAACPLGREPVVPRVSDALEVLARAAGRGPGARSAVPVDGVPLRAALLRRAGAVELVVHGWDVAAALDGGDRRPPPPAALAAALLPVVPLVVPPPAQRGTLFAAPLAARGDAPPGERLLAALGRRCGPPGPPFG